MVLTMIDECMFEVKSQDLKIRIENDFSDRIQLLSTKRRKRICDAYNEIECGYKKRREE